MPLTGNLLKVLPMAAVLAVALALAGCGRKGPLEAPPDAKVEGQPKTLPAGTAPPKVPERRFVLDRLL
jgi:predicted small lipoprotein YifL